MLAPRVGAGLEEALHQWLDEHPGAKLIVIDILEKVRPPRTRNGSVYHSILKFFILDGWLH